MFIFWAALGLTVTECLTFYRLNNWLILIINSLMCKEINKRSSTLDSCWKVIWQCQFSCFFSHLFHWRGKKRYYIFVGISLLVDLLIFNAAGATPRAPAIIQQRWSEQTRPYRSLLYNYTLASDTRATVLLCCSASSGNVTMPLLKATVHTPKHYHTHICTHTQCSDFSMERIKGHTAITGAAEKVFL